MTGDFFSSVAIDELDDEKLLNLDESWTRLETWGNKKSDKSFMKMLLMNLLGHSRDSFGGNVSSGSAMNLCRTPVAILTSK